MCDCSAIVNHDLMIQRLYIRTGSVADLGGMGQVISPMHWKKSAYHAVHLDSCQLRYRRFIRYHISRDRAFTDITVPLLRYRSHRYRWTPISQHHNSDIGVPVFRYRSTSTPILTPISEVLWYRRYELRYRSTLPPISESITDVISGLQTSQLDVSDIGVPDII